MSFILYRDGSLAFEGTEEECRAEGMRLRGVGVDHIEHAYEGTYAAFLERKARGTKKNPPLKGLKSGYCGLRITQKQADGINAERTKLAAGGQFLSASDYIRMLIDERLRY